MAAPQILTQYATGQLMVTPVPQLMYHLSPAADAEIIYKAMKGVGTNDSLLSNIIVTRTRDHLQLVKESFKQQFGKTMEQWIKDDTSGDYKNLLLALVEEAAVFDAKAVYDAMKGIGTNDHRLVEIICTRSNYEIQQMKIAYQRLYNKAVEDDVKGDTSGDYEKILKRVLNAHRAETQPFTLDDVKHDAHSLYKAGEGRLGTNDEKFIEIFTTRSLPMIYAIAQEYEKERGHSLLKAIEKETSGNYKRALTVIATPRDQYFAQEIYSAMEGLGTVDERLIRHLSYLSNYPALFKDVYRAYHTKYGKKLEDDIKGDTSGWYLKTAVQIVKYRCL